MLTPEQEEEIKRQILEQIETSFPEDRKEFAKNQVKSMDSEQLEKFLIKNNLAMTENKAGGQCVFCSIAFGDIKSYKISENKKAIAVLEINPLTRGHVIIIPKEHITSEKGLPKEAFNLAKKISSIIKSKLKPNRVKQESSNIMGHEIINIIPLYDSADPQERKHASQEELSELQEIFKKKTLAKKSPVRKKRSIKKIIKEFEEKIWLPKRIP
jgi:histidine triad (HIT) family protein